MLRLLPTVVVLCAIAGCADRPDDRTIWPVAPLSEGSLAGARQDRIFVATTRAEAPMPANAYTSGRAMRMAFSEFTVSIPPDHVPGQIEWPKGVADPRTDFAVTQHARMDRTSFMARLSSADAQGTGVFVHGYNHTFPESLYRAAQIGADAQIPGASILFSWPSSASLLGYARDQQSAAYSRDALADLLTEVAMMPGTKPVTVFGHSMGAWLVMEALRQMRLAGQDDALARLEVILAAPDIDIDVFRRQIAVVERMEIPMVVMVSRDDRALRLSGLANRQGSLGAIDITEPQIQAAAAAANVVLLDISSVKAGSPINHDRYIKLAAAYPEFVNEARQGGSLTKAGAFVLDSAGQIITAPLRAVDAVLGQ